MISKNPYDPALYAHYQMLFETVVVSSSMRSDFSALLKSFRETEITEYEELFYNSYQKLMNRIHQRMKEYEIDAIFNVDIRVEPLYSGSLVMSFSGDGVRKNDSHPAL